MIIGIASGKGGTGKTTVATNLAVAMGKPVQLLDCDVEAPNAHLFLGGAVVGQENASIPTPHINVARCDGCGRCSEVCVFNAIAAVAGKALVFESLCHGCGSCTMACPQNAITEYDRPIGIVETRTAGDVTLVSGRLDVGVPMAPPLIRAVTCCIAPDTPAILDAPPGTSCPVIATLRSADVVVLVTEPTPFGLHDLTLAVDMVRELGRPFGVIINRDGIGDDRVHRFCAEAQIPLLGELPDDRRVAEAYARGELMVTALPEFRARFLDILERIHTLRDAALAQEGAAAAARNAL
ncbi:MAG: ATP-binding protein [Candidatus Hydrogenedentota bacterium]